MKERGRWRDGEMERRGQNPGRDYLSVEKRDKGRAGINPGRNWITVEKQNY
jgi:hypothetical protein